MKKPVLGFLWETLRRNCNNDAVKMVLMLGAIAVLGMGVAAAAISIGTNDRVNPAMRRLSYTHGLAVAPAFGKDDEDCITVTRRQVLPDRRVRVHRELICRQ
jgi:hypothetical protein